MSATDAFMGLWRSGVHYLTVLVEVDLRSPSTLATTTMRFSTAEALTPVGATSGKDPAYWAPRLVEALPILAPGSFGSTAVELCSTSIRLLPGSLPNALLVDGATVRVFLWDTRLTDWDDALLVFTGVVIRTLNNAEGITLDLRQRSDWNRLIAPATVTVEAYPQAPEDSVGQRIPVVYGRHTTPELRRPWSATPSFADITGATVLRGRSLIMGSRRVGAAILVDTGRGAGASVNPKAKVLVASHKCFTVADHLFNAGVFMKVGDSLAGLDPVSPGDVVNTATEAGMLIPDNAALAWANVRPSDVDVVANSAENPRAVLDPQADTNYAKLDWTNGFKTLRMKLSSLEEPGEMTEVYAFVGYRSVANTNLTLRVRNTTSGATSDIALSATGTRKLTMKRVGTAWATGVLGQPWSFVDVELEFGWPTSTTAITGTGTAEIWLAGMVVRFKPRRMVVTSERTFDSKGTRPSGSYPHEPRGKKPVYLPYTVHETIPAVTQLEGSFFANVEGYADDGQYAPAGSFTGGVGAVVERPSDVVAHALVGYGGESVLSIERGVGVFGSLVDARALLRTRLGDDMLLAFSVNENADLNSVLSWIATGCLGHIYLDRFSDKWHMLAWNDVAPLDYPWLFRPRDIVERASLTAERTPLSEVLTGVDLSYGHDAFESTYRHSARLSWNGSAAGYKYRGLRDENLSVVGTAQSKLDFIASIPGTATIPSGDYDSVSYAIAVQAAMKAAVGGNDYCVVRGATIIANGGDGSDSIFFRDHLASVDRTVELAAQEFPSMQTMMTYIAAQMTLACGTPNQPIVGAYSRSNRKCSFQRVDNLNHVAVNLTLYTTTGTLRNRRLYMTLGFDSGTPAAPSTGPIIAEDEREEELFVVACTGNAIDLLWETGTNGLKGTRLTCAPGLGFSMLRDSLSGGTQRAWLGDCPKHNREQGLARTAARYGAKKDTTIDLRVVNDTETVRELRARTARVFGRTRTHLAFSTDMAPDLERGRVIGFSDDFDTVMPYPDPDTDGSWVGKRFVVVETEQQLGPVAFYVKVRAVSLD